MPSGIYILELGQQDSETITEDKDKQQVNKHYCSAKLWFHNYPSSLC